MRILVSALEPSSNLHLGEVLKHLNDDIEIIGVFDGNLILNEKLKKNALYTPRDFSVMGFVDVGKKLPFLLKAQKELAKLAESADKVLLMDSSSFHIPLAKKIKSKYPSTPIYYYILPQVWAWKKWRAKSIEANCDKLLAILPFEVGYYKSKAQYVGHPLLDGIGESRSNFKGQGVVFMPGSRAGEIRQIFPVFKQVAKSLQGIKKTLVVPQFFQSQNLESIYGNLDDFEVSFDAKVALWNAEFAFICSGTATLEAALIGTPFVLGYKTARLDYCIARALVKLRYIGLANIFFNALCGEVPGLGENKLHIELIQDSMNVKNLLEAYEKFDRKKFYQDSLKLRAYLQYGSALNVANILKH